MTKLYQHGKLTDVETVLEEVFKDDGLDCFRQLLYVNRPWTVAHMLENEALNLKQEQEYNN
ncbi:MAG: hypothetical protein ACYTEX_26860 [Planctomycetota bacterium]|jgi:hypothetical protein